MPWCPTCKTEYRDGYDTCSDCGSTLVSELVAEPDLKDGEAVYDHAEFLITVDGSIDAGILEGLLRSNGIPSLLKPRNAGGYMSIYTGQARSGVDIYVPAGLAEKAKDLVQGFYEETASEGVEDAGDDPVEDPENTEDFGELDTYETDETGFAEDITGPAGETDESGTISEQEAQAYKRQQRFRSWVAFFLFVPGLTFIILYMLFKLLGLF